MNPLLLVGRSLLGWFPLEKRKKKTLRKLVTHGKRAITYLEPWFFQSSLRAVCTNLPAPSRRASWVLLWLSPLPRLYPPNESVVLHATCVSFPARPLRVVDLISGGRRHLSESSRQRRNNRIENCRIISHLDRRTRLSDRWLENG